MFQLRTTFPDPDVLLALEPEELAAKLLFLLRSRADLRERFNPNGLDNELWQNVPGFPPYPRERADEINLAVAEAFAWLEAQGLAVPDSGMNGSHGWRRLSRRARRIENEADFTQYATARRLPREMLHPKLSKTVWLAFMRGEFDVAVFQAMKTVEVAVRDAAELPDKLVGMALMRKAFDIKNGPLTDMEEEEGERDARSALFAGAIGSYKNPHSHREVPLGDAAEAIEIIMLANHLLRIVDGRKAAKV
jgi:uncharacterized protein (TIGR02391 family)